MGILIVDSDESVSKAYVRVLERAGFMVTTAENGLTALALLHRGSFRAIVCDTRTQFLEGSTFYEELDREFPAMARRVVFVTGWADDESVRELEERTGRPVVSKRGDAREFVAVVRQVVQERA